MTAIKPLSLIAQFDDIVRCRNALTVGIESGLLCFYGIIIIDFLTS